MLRHISSGVDGGGAECLGCADPGARTPIGASGNSIILRDWRVLSMFLPMIGNFFRCSTLSLAFSSVSFTAISGQESLTLLLVLPGQNKEMIGAFNWMIYEGILETVNNRKT